MKSPSLGLFAVFVCSLIIAACSQAPPFSGFQYIPNAKALRNSGPTALNYTVLYRFGAPPDGRIPFAGVVGKDGTFYGTTGRGGAYRCSQYGDTCGTVFSITTSGIEKVLHSFGKGTDGSAPDAGLFEVSGTFYGTTGYGGAYSCGQYGGACGTVFSITTEGVEKVLHSFGKGTDGNGPVAGLLEVGGTLYGTTTGGGTYGGGTVFSITTGGVEKVLHSFGKGSDGREPDAGLLSVGGTLYGTTSIGGANTCGYYGCGTVFRITTDGTEKVLHSFGKGTDGASPRAHLIEVKGTLYGTTEGGGTYHNGTVFSITTDGNEKVMYSFHKGTDGNVPGAGLIDVGGTLYGTTLFGGKYNDDGTLFSITTSGVEKVLHSFGSGTDGNFPESSLKYDGQSLIGTTTGGGSSNHGTVFLLTP